MKHGITGHPTVKFFTKVTPEDGVLYVGPKGEIGGRNFESLKTFVIRVLVD